MLVGFTKYAAETESACYIYIPSFIKISSVIQKLWWRYTHILRSSHRPYNKIMKVALIGSMELYGSINNNN
jgi:hypothetical protein